MGMLVEAAACRHLRAFRAAGAGQADYVKPSKRIFDDAKVCDHFAIIPTLQAPSGLSEVEAEALRLGRSTLSVGVFPERRIPWSRRASAASAVGQVSVPDRRQGAGQAGLARRSTARKPQDDEKKTTRTKSLVPVQPGEMVRTESVEIKGLKTRPPARYSEATLLRRDGRRRQVHRRRRTARGDAGEGPRHAGHARGHHRRSDRKNTCTRRPRADPDRQGIPADDAAARPRRGGTFQGRTHRRVGIQARADGARQAQRAKPSCAKSPR